MPESTGSHNIFDGNAEVVVQISGSVMGSVNVGMPAPDRPRPRRLVPPPTDDYVNNQSQLDDLSATADAAAEDTAPLVIAISGDVGSGRSELARKWADLRPDRTPDGQFYVAFAVGDGLGAVRDALGDLLKSAGFAADAMPDSLEARSAWWRDWSARKSVLVVVDGPVTAAQVRALLPGKGRSVVIVTDDAGMGALAATVKPKRVELDPLTAESARELLARMAGPERLAAESAAVDELISLCEGSTVALCVCGALLAQFPSRPVSRLVAELGRAGRRLRTLSKVDELAVRRVLDTAVSRLDEDGHRCYAAFGVHPGTGSISVEALAFALDEDVDDAWAAVDQLVLLRLARQTSDGRFMLGNSLKLEHARECADRLEAPSALGDRFAAYYTTNGIAAGHAMLPERGWLTRFWPGVLDGLPTPSAASAERWLLAERATLRALVEAEGEAEEPSVRALQLAVALWPLQERGKHLDDLDVVNAVAADVAEHLGETVVRALLMTQRGYAFRFRGERDKAAGLYREAVALVGADDEPAVHASALESLGIVLGEQRLLDEAREALRSNLELAVAIGKPSRIAKARMHLGAVLEPAEALPMLEQAAHGLRSLRPADEYNLAKVARWRGEKLTSLGQFAAAQESYASALEYMVSHDRHHDVALVLRGVGRLAALLGDRSDAKRAWQAAVDMSETHGFADLAEQVRADLNELDG